MTITPRWRIVVGIGVMAAFCGGVRPGSAQSLVEAARQEAARRKAVKGPAKVYTNDNLVQVPGETIPTPPGPAPVTPKPADDPLAKPAAGAAAATGASAATPPGDVATTPEYWRKRIGDVRDQIDRNKVYLDSLQSRINGLWADFTSRDDPAQRAVIAGERQRALNELDRLTKEQQDLQNKAAAIEEEARRAGVPPGWLR
ncbi:MAG: hypothetical protein NTV05_00870 [Acidobacteria bacterium]|nr:hypothetical protein [Acidobacteriota bacterium]